MKNPKSHVEDRIEAMLNGELARDEDRLVRDHCAACVDCRKNLERSLEVRRLLELYPPLVPSVSLWPAVSLRLARERAPLYRFAATMALAACAVAGVSLGVYLGQPDASPRAEEGLWSVLESTVVVDSPGLHTVYLNESQTEGAPSR